MVNFESSIFFMGFWVFLLIPYLRFVIVLYYYLHDNILWYYYVDKFGYKHKHHKLPKGYSGCTVIFSYNIDEAPQIDKPKPKQNIQQMPQTPSSQQYFESYSERFRRAD